ncbi:sigma-70 family RNA polymerase sigma factor [Nocardia sp. NBC_00565]|uniref:RNA polymerase sigma factor n=1 Tax=Nocardia sp. NBC_00565 TaxID=2975993 RepID=UPI002E8129B8|nr:sigma-70 family RNA polymerase sigma factor [Nocardia sp. NBC_00565]WUC06501.1 sigma-70 family RNA polymerase sigma factor [Nocardia sp. NBC_00565]
MSTADNGDWVRDVALIALLGAVLQDCAREPLSLLASAPETSVIRIGRGGVDSVRAFDDLLIEAYESTKDMLLASVTKQVGSRTDAEDIVQTAFMRVYAARPGITDAEELRRYIWTAAKNLTRDTWRRAANDRDRLDPDGETRIAQLADSAGLAFDDVIALRHTLIAALNAVPARERQAVVVRAFEGNTYAETAAIMGVGDGTVKAYVHAALKRLRANIEAA